MERINKKKIYLHQKLFLLGPSNLGAFCNFSVAIQIHLLSDAAAVKDWEQGANSFLLSKSVCSAGNLQVPFWRKRN